MRHSMRTLLVVCAAGLMLVLFASCPQPITPEVVYEVEDTIAPVITVASPQENSTYYSSVQIEGTILDDSVSEGDGLGAVRAMEFSIANDVLRRGRITVDADGTVTKDEEFGSGVIDFDSETGVFSFSFSTIGPLLEDTITIQLSASDGNANETYIEISLVENEGPIVEILKPSTAEEKLYKKGITHVYLEGTIGNSASFNDSDSEITTLAWQNPINGWSGVLDITEGSEDWDANTGVFSVENEGITFSEPFIYDPAERKFSTSFDVPWDVSSQIPLEVQAQDFNEHTTVESVTLYLDEAGPAISLTYPEEGSADTFYSPLNFTPQTVSGYISDFNTVAFIGYQVRALGFNPDVVELDIDTHPGFTDFYTDGSFDFNLDDGSVDLSGISGTVTVTVIARNDDDGQSRPQFQMIMDDRKPVINSIALSSSNTISERYAKENDTVTLSFEVHDDDNGVDGDFDDGSGLGNTKPVVTIAGHTIDPSKVLYQGNYIWEATYEMATGDGTDAYIPFTINATDLSGNPADEVTEAILSDPDKVTYYEQGAGVLIPVSISNVTQTGLGYAKPGDTVQVSFTADRDISGLPSVTIEGHPATLTDSTYPTYSARVQMQEGDPEHAIEFEITYTDMAGNAESHTTGTTDATEVVYDETPPVISSVAFDTTDGWLKVGSVETLTITTGGTENDYTAGTLSVNGRSGSPWISALGGGTGGVYTFTYTVGDGDTDRTDTDYKIPMTVSVVDTAGNESAAYTQLATDSDSVDMNNPIIDGHTPTISSVDFNTPSGNWLKIGSVETLTVTASEEGLSADTLTVNGRSGLPWISALGGGTGGEYTFTYTVQETDTDRADTQKIPLQVQLSDNAGNTSDLFEVTAGTDSSDEYPAVDGNKPEAPTGCDITTVNIAADGKTTLTGSGESGTTVWYEITDEGTGTTGEVESIVTVSGDNTFEVPDIGVGSLGLADGTLTARVWLVDEAGNIGAYDDSATALKDTSAPTISLNATPFSPSSGLQPLGTSIYLTVDAGEWETGLDPDTVTINGQLIDLAHFADNADGTYTFEYISTETDNGDIPDSEKLPLSITLQDDAGNPSNTISVGSGVDDTGDDNNPGVDIHAPTISLNATPFSPSSGLQPLGTSIYLTVDAGGSETGLDLDSVTINGQAIDQVHFTDNTDGTYTFEYISAETDTGDVPDSEKLPLSITLQDDAGNASNTISVGSGVDDTGDDNNPGVDIHAPTISLNATPFSPASGLQPLGTSIYLTVDAGGSEAGLDLDSVTINGQGIDAAHFTDNADGTYTFEYISTETDNGDIPDSEKLPLSITLQDDAGNASNTISVGGGVDDTVDDNNPGVDIHAPTISLNATPFSPASGLQPLGTSIYLTVDAGGSEAGLDLDSVTINGQGIDAAHFTDNADGTYTFEYISTETDTGDVPDSEKLPLSITLQDDAGNPSNTISVGSGVDDTGDDNNPGVDIHAPTISLNATPFSPSSGLQPLGTSIYLTVDAGGSEAGLDLDSVTINGQAIDQVHFTDNTDGTYTFEYISAETDTGDVPDSEKLPLSITLQDDAGNPSNTISVGSGVDDTGDDNNPGVDIYAPTAPTIAAFSAADVWTGSTQEISLSGTFSTGEGVSAVYYRVTCDGAADTTGWLTATLGSGTWTVSAFDVFSWTAGTLSAEVYTADSAGNQSTSLTNNYITVLEAEISKDDATKVFIDFSGTVTTGHTTNTNYDISGTPTRSVSSAAYSDPTVTLTLNGTIDATYDLVINPGVISDGTNYVVGGTYTLVVSADRSLSLFQNTLTRIKNTFTSNSDNSTSRSARRLSPIPGITATEASSPAGAPEKTELKRTPPPDEPRQTDRVEPDSPQPTEPLLAETEAAPEDRRPEDNYATDDFIYRRQEAPAAGSSGGTAAAGSSGGGATAGSNGGAAASSEPASAGAYKAFELTGDTEGTPKALTLALIILIAVASIALVFFLFIRMMRTYGE